jgi:hypothetical protein
MEKGRRWIILSVILTVLLIWSLPCLTDKGDCDKPHAHGPNYVADKLVIICEEADCKIQKEPAENQSNQTCWNGPICWIWSGGNRYWTLVRDDPVALFTGLLFASTTLLWWTTHNLWKAGERQLEHLERAANAAQKSADVAAGVQVPRFPLFEAEWAGSDLRISVDRRKLFLSAVNRGLTTAEMLGWSMDWKVVKHLPDQPVYPEMRELRNSVEAGQPWKVTLSENDLDFTPEDGQDIIARKNTLWIYGFLKYRDFLGTEYDQGFCIALKVSGDLIIALSTGSARQPTHIVVKMMAAIAARDHTAAS